MDKITLFYNIVQMAAVDGKFTDEEIRHLIGRANQWQIPDEEFETAVAGISTGKTEVDIPESQEDRTTLLKEMILMMAVDGELAEVEKDLCARISVNMGFSPARLKETIESLLKRD